ncbi:Hypothetical protein GbCGDNIH9_1017 [Granulibacter bethesdensis]|uniref:Uncharacterized protein n=2 Tax=Granulibacter bethesdensis TaxID=364410 RepID=A0AAC9KBP8_9PROT|nr:Hypothetical protein GbCGDNIH9_1017 [Granulibacter bethesdensis]APH61898.1 Hypothetical protein GbCGDNIH8_1017 [Granulibacter bethesdensis]
MMPLPPFLHRGNETTRSVRIMALLPDTAAYLPVSRGQTAMNKPAAITILLIGLSACSHPDPDLRAGKPVYYPLSLHDASYKAHARIIAGNSPDCTAPHAGIFTVGDHSITYAYSSGLVFTPLINENGFFKETIGSNVFQGQFTGNRLLATLTMPTCTIEYRGREVWNHSATSPIPVSWHRD